jgi:hypothetical protein
MFLTTEQRIERLVRKTAELIAATTLTAVVSYTLLAAFLFL